MPRKRYSRPRILIQLQSESHLDHVLARGLRLRSATGDDVRVESEMTRSLIEAVTDLEDTVPPGQPHRPTDRRRGREQHTVRATLPSAQRVLHKIQDVGRAEASSEQHRSHFATKPGVAEIQS